MKYASLLLVTAALSTGPVFAAEHNHAMPGHEMHGATASAPVQEAVADAEVKAVDPKGLRVTVKHAPIPAFNWPAMTMEMAVESEAVLKGVNTGDKVKLHIRKVSATQYVVTDITK